VGRDGTKDITFTVAKSNAAETMAELNTLKETLGANQVICDESVSKVSIVGAGMETHPGVASKMFEALFDAGINIQMISTSEIKISVLIDAKDSEKALNAVHDAFID